VAHCAIRIEEAACRGDLIQSGHEITALASEIDGLDKASVA
jgi:hypothetical protein